MKRRFTITESYNGDFAVRKLSKKAQKYYYGTDPLGVFEVETDDGVRYYVTGSDELSAVTFEEMQEYFEAQQAECDRSLLEERLTAWVDEVLDAYGTAGSVDTLAMVADVDKIIAEAFDHAPVIDSEVRA